MIYGKIIAGIIGLVSGGFWGLVLGVLVGHAFDIALTNAFAFGSPENLAKIQASFFETTFLLLGYLAKSDGQVSQHEIDHTEAIINQMQLSAPQRTRAIDFFKRGAMPEFQPEPVAAAFLQICGSQKQLHQTLLLFLVSLALADQQIAQAEREALTRVASLLGVGKTQLEMLLRMAQAQGHFHGTAGAPEQAASHIDDAYTALGVSPEVSDKDLKRAYRKLMSEHHPDKLIARGVPEAMVKIATAKAQEIQGAYAMIRKHRGSD